MPISIIHKALIDAWESLGEHEEIYIRKSGKGSEAKAIIKRETTIVIGNRLVDNSKQSVII